MCKLDKIVVVDFEATCWDGPVPPNQYIEIIQIGICLYNIKTELIERQNSFLVKPEISIISEYCKNLTGINTGSGFQGRYLNEVLNTIKKEYSIKSNAWASWGSGDRRQLLEECASKAIRYPFGSGYLDIQALFSYKHKLSQGPKLIDALHMMMLEFIGKQHNARDDAMNAARILKGILHERN